MEWTDRRMDDFAKRVDDGFKEAKGDIVRLDAKIDRLDAKIDAKIEGLDAKIDAKIEGLDAKIDAKIEGLREESNAQFKLLDSKIDTLDEKFTGQFMGLYKTVIGGSFATCLAVMGPVIVKHLGF